MTSSQLSQEVAAVPFLWTMPLGWYLLSFVFCFDHPRWYLRPLWLLLCVAGLIGAEFAVWVTLVMPISRRRLLGFGLFAAYGVSREPSRPAHPRHLTLYLCLRWSAALAVCSSPCCPMLFIDYWELAIGYFLVPIVVGIALFMDGKGVA
ncbi:MAG: hypothetical protein R3B96_22605 [Pirellulaceae bacterium]